MDDSFMLRYLRTNEFKHKEAYDKVRNEVELWRNDDSKLKRRSEESSCKITDNIKMYLKEIVCGIMGYINMADDKITGASC